MANSPEEQGDITTLPTTEIKLWIDPANGKYLGKYDDFAIEGNGIIYGKADNGKVKTPLYKVAVHNFNNPQGLLEIDQGHFVETTESGNPVIGTEEVRGGLIEQSNVDFKANISYYQESNRRP